MCTFAANSTHEHKLEKVTTNSRKVRDCYHSSSKHLPKTWDQAHFPILWKNIKHDEQMQFKIEFNTMKPPANMSRFSNLKQISSIKIKETGFFKEK